MPTALPTYEPRPLPSPPARARHPRTSAPTPLPPTSLPGHRHLTRLLTALVEAMAGRRSPNQLAPHLTYPTQTALRVLPRQPPTLRLRSVHTCQLDPTTVEIAATLIAGRRAKALAARLEHTGRTWQFTALHVIGG
ncbi:Rv3235 family protein [Actinokineospora sp. NPDC004072]